MLSKNEVKSLRALHNAKGREAEKKFIASGAKLVDEIIRQMPGIIKAVYASQDFMVMAGALPALKKMTVKVVGDEELRSISTQDTPNKAVAVCDYFSPAVQRYDASRKSAFYLDDIRDPGNFGTIMRVCDWFGMDTLFCSPASCEQYNPKVIQSTMGSFLRVKVVYAELDAVISEFKPRHVYGAVLDGEDLHKKALQSGLIILGNESHGISEANRKLLTDPLTIPAHPGSKTESLNAAMAAGIISSEFFRQLR